MLGRTSLERSSIQEDIISGNNEWLNIQDIIRLTFKQMSNTLQNQERAIISLEKQMGLKTSRSEVQALIGHKLDSEEFHVETNSLRSLIQNIRADTSDLICASREDYVNDYRKIIAELESKAGKNEVKNQVSELEYQRNLNSIEIKENRKELEGKIMAVKNQVAIDIDYSREMNMIEFDKILEGNKMICMEIAENRRFCQEVDEELMRKIVNLADDSEAILQLQQNSAEEIKRTVGALKSELFSEIRQLAEGLSRVKQDLDHTKHIKSDNSQVLAYIQVKNDEISKIHEELLSFSSQLKTKTPLEAFEKDCKGLKESSDQLKLEITQKYDEKLLEFQEVLDSKASKDAHFSHIDKQEAINETLCSENTIARWRIDEKKNLKGEVNWETQCVNTCPENFIWQRDSSEISIVSAGCYEVILGFYSEKNPFVQVYVNNELVFSLVNCPSYAVQQSGVAGVTLNEHFLIQENSFVKVMCEAKAVSSAFFSLRKI